MTYKLFTCVILLLSCDLAPIIYAGKPVLAKSPHIVTHVQPKTSTTTTESTPVIKPQQQLKQKNVMFSRGILEDSQKTVSLEATEFSADHMELLNELKQESPSYLPWHPYASTPQSVMNFPFQTFASMFDHVSAISSMPKLMPYFGYSQPIFIPFPVMMTSDMFYPSYADMPSSEDTMSRTSSNGRRPPSAGSMNNIPRNSPIYYLKLPPTPYMFLPSFNYAPTASLPPLFPYSPISAFHALPMSSILNLPLNFVGNGKPSGIYRIDSAPSELLNSQFQFTGTRPSSFSNSYPMRPISSNLTPPPPSPETATSTFSAHQPATFPSPSAASTLTQPDSKLISFKRPFVFNGRPEDIYIFPNNFNPSIYSENSFY